MRNMIEIDSIGGLCPVQAEGSINATSFYFRARGNRWSLSVGGECPVSNPEFYYEEEYEPEDEYAAGYMDEKEALVFIGIGLGKYLSKEKTNEPE